MRIVGQTQIAAVFGVVPKTIGEWQDAGFPVAVQGGDNRPSEYESAECIQWLVRREVGKVQGESPRDRVFRLQGDAMELELAEKQGRLIDVSQVEPKWLSAVVASREGLLRERRRLAKLVAGVHDVQRCEEIIGKAHEDFLRRLSTWRQTGDDIEPKGIEP